MNEAEFAAAFDALTGNTPFPWQWALYQRFTQGEFPPSCALPTGLGKTSVIAVWLIALANHATLIPRRLVYVVNRRTVVDQSTEEAIKIRNNLERVPNLAAKLGKLAISTLRGQFEDNRAWSADPSQPAVIVGTVDMIGSRLLFSGYGCGFKSRPLHAGFLGQDVLLVHDEAHLEPAFQKLLTEIEKEQRRCRDFATFRVMELSATSRGEGETFVLGESDYAHPEVKKRIQANKTIVLHPLDDKNKLAERIVDLALAHQNSGRAVLVFVRRVDDVGKIVKKLKGPVQQLTGTLRGLERDRMANPTKESGCPIFARFLKPPSPGADEKEQWKVQPTQGTVYLVCTSAGEVGVNLSADHLICDLSTFESMAQRFGRVNRFGECQDTRIDIVHPTQFADDDEIEVRLNKTLDLLRDLIGNGSPAALGALNADARQAAFAPMPIILPTSDILFDAWALTTIRGKLPGRPPVEPYLHGVSGEPPETHVAWREEVWELRLDFQNDEDRKTREAEDRKRLASFAADLLEDYPLKPHELLRDASDRVFKHLAAIAARHPDYPTWLLDNQGAVQVLTLKELANKDRKEQINYRTILLPPDAGGLRLNAGKSSGLLDGNAKYESAHRRCYDVADEWKDDQGRQRRTRVWDAPVPDGMRLIRPPIDVQPDAEGANEDTPGKRFWKWCVRPRSADDDLSKTAKDPVTWDDHTNQVVRNATRIAAALNLPPELQTAIQFAARWHDLGKRREIWQRSIGNVTPQDWYAKSGKDWRPIEITDYRHEFGSLLDLEKLKVEPDFQRLCDEIKDLVRHLIAAHHGRGRPHFPADEVFDPNHNEEDAVKIAAATPQRFARLQRQYGRWGLAYLESLLRAADYDASANPSATVEGQP